MKILAITFPIYAFDAELVWMQKSSSRLRPFQTRLERLGELSRYIL